MADLIFIGDIVEANGKTVKQNNLNQKHSIPVGSLVEIIEANGENEEEAEQRYGLRLFVIAHTRDCDGTPLYALGFCKTAYQQLEEINKLLETEKNDMERCLLNVNKYILQGAIDDGYDEESLKIIS